MSKQKLEFHKNWAILKDGKDYVTGKTWFECYQFAIELSKKYRRTIRLIPLVVAKKLFQKDRKFRELMKGYWIWNAEFIFEKDCIREIDGIKLKWILYENMIASVRSGSGGGSFGAGAGWPSGWDADGLAVFEVI